jgi:hypothetical protein
MLGVADVDGGEGGGDLYAGLPVRAAAVAALETGAGADGPPAACLRIMSLPAVVADELRIEVTDTAGDRPPRPPHPGYGPGPGSDTESESGRGLLLVEALADRWGWTPELRPRKTVRAELLLPPDDVQSRRMS